METQSETVGLLPVRMYSPEDLVLHVLVPLKFVCLCEVFSLPSEQQPKHGSEPQSPERTTRVLAVEAPGKLTGLELKRRLSAAGSHVNTSVCVAC